MLYSVKSMKNDNIYLKLLLCVCIITALLAFPKEVSSGAAKGIKTCGSAVIPSLFPFLAVSGYLFSAISARYKGHSTAFAVVFAFLGGYPSGAHLLGSLAENGAISRKRASRLLCGCVNAGPAFVISGVGAGIFGNSFAGLTLFICTSLASAVCLLAFRDGSPRAPESGVKRPASVTFTEAVSSAASATVTICAYVVLFSCLLGVVDCIARGAGLESYVGAVYMLGEVSTACSFFGALGNEYGLFGAAAAVSLCGVSVIMQIKAEVSKRGISIRPFMLSRLLHLPLSLAFVKAALALFPSQMEAFSNVSGAAVVPFNISPAASISLFLTVLVFLFGSKKLSFLH